MIQSTIAKLNGVSRFNQGLSKRLLSLVMLLSAIVFGTMASPAFAAEIEPLHGFELTERYATIIVTSTGCTQKEDFITILEATTPPIVTFVRLQPDSCKAVARPYPIRFSLEEVGAQEFKVANPIVPSPAYY